MQQRTTTASGKSRSRGAAMQRLQRRFHSRGGGWQGALSLALLAVLTIGILQAAGPLREPAVVKAQACSWTGRWMWGNGSIATFPQAGTEVTGDDGSGDDITGTVAGNRFTGRWTHGSDSGPIDLTMESSCNGFTGTFGYDSGRPPDPFNGTRVGGAQPTPTPPAGNPSAPDLTGLWVDNSGGGATYRLRQIDDRLYWSVDATAVGSFANIFVGTIDGATIRGTWVDLPGSPMLGGGSLTLRIESNDHLVKVEETSFYPPQEWFRQSGDRGTTPPAPTAMPAGSAGCPQWDVSGVWQTAHGDGSYHPTFTFQQTGTALSGTAQLSADEQARAGYTSPTGSVTGTVQGDQLDVIVTWMRADGPVRGRYFGTVTQGRVNGQGVAVGASSGIGWSGSGPTRCVSGD